MRWAGRNFDAGREHHAWVVWGITVLVPAFVTSELKSAFQIGFMIFIPFLILSLAALGVNILVGYCGQISLGSGAFMAVGAYAAYNRDAPAQARLSGLQLDIEPYLNSGYQLDTEEWLAAYLDTMSRVRAQAMMPLDVAVPFWWERQRFRNSLFLDHLGTQIDVVSVMNYRTERQQLIDLAEPFLEWGTRAKKTIRIGLEAGPIPDESLHVFHSSSRGDLWLMPLGDNNLLVSLDTTQANPAARVFTYSHSITRQGTNTTFHRNIGAMQKLLPELEKVWRAWPSFGGIALHGLDAD